MKDYGLVSIITPSWACGKFIGETIKSVQAQTYQNWELLVQDDYSTDNTREVVAVFAQDDSRIKYECNPINSGAAITRNNALRRASGRWIAFLDSDDLWLPEKLERQLDFMVKNNYAFSYHKYAEMNENGTLNGITVSGIRKVSLWDFRCCNWVGCLTVMYNSQIVGLIQIKDIRSNNDTAMWLKVARVAPCYRLSENLALYRRRQNGITPKPIMKKLKSHYNLFHYAEEMTPVQSVMFTIFSVAGHCIKKVLFVRKSKS
jgi:glycosyltransferase involved in cell wall biosynthesis